MKKVKFTVMCNAIYKSELELPDGIDATNKDAVLEYIRNNLSDAPVNEIEWLSDLEDTDSAVTKEDIRSIEEE